VFLAEGSTQSKFFVKKFKKMLDKVRGNVYNRLCHSRWEWTRKVEESLEITGFVRDFPRNKLPLENRITIKRKYGTLAKDLSFAERIKFRQRI
jgi:hypothetical protein